MENASKALIIAGAILLSIIIISLGIVVVTNARNSMKGADLSDTQIQTFNSKFTAFTGAAGKTISASELSSLLETVMTSNLQENNAKSGRYVYVTGSYWDGDDNASKTLALGNASEGSYTAITSLPNISSAKRYKVTPTYSSITSLIWKITVELAA